MKSSIRKFMLTYLLLAIIGTTCFTIIANYILDRKEIQDHLDTLLALSALSYEALLGEDTHKRPLNKMQQALNNIPATVNNYYKKNYLLNFLPQDFIEKFNFQVWNNQGQLLLYSPPQAKTLPFPTTEGFSDKHINGNDWRIFKTHNPNAGISTVLAERYYTRNELIYRIAVDDFYLLLITFPLSGLLIWLIITRGLSSLKQVAEEVANRAPTHLEPVNLEKIPLEIKPVIDELNKLFNRLKEGFEREKRFAADAAHELRTPLAALKAQAQVALHTKNMEEKNTALQKLIASVNRSTHVVQQLLTMSKLVPEATSLNDIGEVNLVKITREVLAMLAPSALEKQIDLEFIHDKNPPDFSGNVTAISILIRNLVDNAIRYCKINGKVLVNVYTLNRELIFEVVDNGPGIPKELQDRVFERFFRVLGNHMSPGSGLGLAIVRQICDLHNGRVELDSPEESTGLIVRVYFPLPN